MRKSFPVSYTIRNDKTLSSGRLSDRNLTQKKFMQKNQLQIFYIVTGERTFFEVCRVLLLKRNISTLKI